jgi:REP element-mobilizing transposase RayT
MSELYQSLSHSKWDCKYHVVFCRLSAQSRNVLFPQSRNVL